jgi:single-strand DNA-binding protein
VDVIDVTCWSAATRRSALRLAEGDTLEVEGALRRRFYRVGPAVQSRYDVVAGSLRRVKR